jgi:protein ImuB
MLDVHSSRQKTNIEHPTSNIESSIGEKPKHIVSRSHGRVVTVPRKRPWTHKLFREGPRDIKTIPGDVRDEHIAPLNIAPLSVAPPATRPKIIPRVQTPPMVLIRTVASRQLIVAASDECGASGMRVGMTLTEGRALCPRLIHFDHDPAQDARSLEALARMMFRFTPVVSIPKRVVSSADHVPNPEGDCIYLDVTGCERVFGGLSNIVKQLIDLLARLRLAANVAVAPTPGAAWALASFSDNGRIVPPEDVPGALSQLPVAALRLDEEILAALHHLGLEKIGQLTNLPRNALPSRFGHTLLMRLDQAMGHATEVLVPLVHHFPVEADIEFDGGVESLEVVWIALRQLLRDIAADLTKRGCGARELTAIFRRAYAPPLEKTVRLSRASRGVMSLFNLLRCALESIETDVGFTGIHLHVPVFERLTEEQISLCQEDDLAGQAELDELIARVVARLGDDAIVQPKLLESHVPERAFTWHGLPARDEKNETRAGSPCHENRPLQLLSMPVEIGVMVSPSDDRDGRPILFRRGSDVHQLTHAIGPERISGEWWRGHEKTRDYFDVEDEEGKRFWVFRVNETGKWYVHGTFT